MNKIILSEEKYKILLEYGGYVNYFSKFIRKAIDDISECMDFYLPKIGYLLKNKDDGEKIDALNELIYDKGYFTQLKYDEEILEKLNIYNINNITIYFMADEHTSGLFSTRGMDIDNNGKINQITIYINVYRIIKDFSRLENILQHELTHAYEYMQKYLNFGKEHSDLDEKNRYYNSDMDNFINRISYYFSKSEINAFVSELYTHLKNNKANRYNYMDIAASSQAGNVLILINDFINRLERNDSKSYKIVKDIMDWIKKNPEHLDLFPSVRNYNVNRYRNRLINMLYDKYKYVYHKIEKVASAYLNDIK